MIYDFVEGDFDFGIVLGILFEVIFDDWYCLICGVCKVSFVFYCEVELKMV